MGSRLLALVAAGAAVALSSLAPSAAGAISERATLHASFTPDRLGASTTISFGFRIETDEGLAPPPLSSVSLRMPAGLDYTATTLGLAICQPATLLARGLAGCPPNSRLGYGNAYVEVPFGSGTGHEIPEIQALMGPPHEGNIVVLFYANGRAPVSAQLVFSGEVLPDAGAFGSRLSTSVPPIPSIAGGSNVSLVSVQSTIGPRGITYYRRRHGRLVPFHPAGIGMPLRCPRGGFPFAAEFGFEDGGRTTASTVVPCPAPSRRA